MWRRFQQVDVFGSTPYSGNPVAVVLEADGLSTEDMSRLGRWTNLSETTFLLPPTAPDADYRVRIFNLAQELSFAGHPTLGSCHAWLAAGNRPRRANVIVQECGAGLVPIRRRAEGLAFAAPPLLRSGPVAATDIEQVTAILQIDPADVVDAQWVDNGPGWKALLLASADAVLAVEPLRMVDGKWDVGVVGPYPPGAECAIEVRGFFSDEFGGIVEDPVTGSLNASVAQWLLDAGRLTAPYVASQGSRLGRTGRARIDQDAEGTVWVGGATTTCVEGRIDV